MFEGYQYPDPKGDRIKQLEAQNKALIEVMETIENDDGKIPSWLWKRIKSILILVKRGYQFGKNQ